eukprot:CAMPEP_0118939388 /NCGR_PEP_ID=MMETSP1169-20130426/28748_1 /TAXON_ID=36882 /ORGANISM="Pyramimonas obovata, Strain CCMP722" /LENGTH=99 /DNA_ID=CAMNT_0006883645 /DNA_START=137 /DNA_END=436 /DNA_ORIENTATION=+
MPTTLKLDFYHLDTTWTPPQMLLLDAHEIIHGSTVTFISSVVATSAACFTRTGKPFCGGILLVQPFIGRGPGRKLNDDFRPQILSDDFRLQILSDTFRL